jgi:hypothetical protein
MNKKIRMLVIACRQKYRKLAVTKNNSLPLKFLWATIVIFLLASASKVQAESSVWVVSSAKTTLYLAGSCHVLRASDYPLPAEFWKAYRDSNKIVFEVTPGEMEKPETAGKVMFAAIYNDGTTLRQHLSAKAYARLESFCEAHDYPIDQFQLYRPWMLALTLTMQELNKMGADPANGVDITFSKKALEDGKSIIGLETVDEQISILTLMGMGLEDDQIVETIDELQQINVTVSDIISAWKQGDEKKLEKLMLKELKDYPRLYQTLIANRNRKWLSDIESYLRLPQKTMVIVGAAHLVGNDGVVELLRKRGYKVTKLQ